MGGKRVGCSSYVTIREGPSNKMTSEQRPGGSEGPGNRGLRREDSRQMKQQGQRYYSRSIILYPFILYSYTY